VAQVALQLPPQPSEAPPHRPVQSGVQQCAAAPDPTHSAPAPLQLLLVQVPPQPSDMPQPLLLSQSGVQQTFVARHSLPVAQAGQALPQLSLTLHSVWSLALVQPVLTQQDSTPLRVTQLPEVQLVQVPPQPSDIPQLLAPQVLVQHIFVVLSQTSGLLQPQVPPQPSDPPQSVPSQTGAQQAFW